MLHRAAVVAAAVAVAVLVNAAASAWCGIYSTSPF
jgi:hypothetical protein